jgi:hypothetical protein
MAKITGSEYAEKWARRLSGAVEDIRKGVESVTEAPGKKAAERKAKWIAKMTDASVQNKWATNVGAVTLDQWKRATAEIGVGRIAAGATASVDKMAKFGEQLISYQTANMGKIKSMPDVTLSDSKARMDAWFDIMSKFRPSK